MMMSFASFLVGVLAGWFAVAASMLILAAVEPAVSVPEPDLSEGERER